MLLLTQAWGVRTSLPDCAQPLLRQPGEQLPWTCALLSLRISAPVRLGGEHSWINQRRQALPA
ncbi:MAG TPA: hypothetical protein GYA08_26355 [Chloroflexi bacterium]|nr:hypothetical protein [Chloroflexota bacterium]